MNNDISNNKSIRQRGNAWQINYSIDGKRYYESFKTKTDAKARLREVKSEKRTLGAKGATKQTLLEFAISQLESSDNNKDTTHASIESILTNYILPALGTMRLTEIHPPEVQQFIDFLVDCGLSPKTIKNISSVLSQMMNRAVRLGLISINPCVRAHLPTVHPYTQAQVLDDDYESFIKLCSSAQDGELYIVAVTTGMRLGELIGLKWCDINSDDCTIHVCRQLQLDRTHGSGEYYEDTLKNHKSRDIKVAKKVIDLLEHIHRAQEYLQAQGELANEEGYVFVGADGTHLKKSTVDKHFRKFVKDHPELPQDLRFHDLRGSYVTRCLDLDISPKTVSSFAGHFSVGFTLDKYGRISERAKSRAADLQQKDLERLLT